MPSRCKELEQWSWCTLETENRFHRLLNFHFGRPKKPTPPSGENFHKNPGKNTLFWWLRGVHFHQLGKGQSKWKIATIGKQTSCDQRQFAWILVALKRIIFSASWQISRTELESYVPTFQQDDHRTWFVCWQAALKISSAWFKYRCLWCKTFLQDFTTLMRVVECRKNHLT